MKMNELLFYLVIFMFGYFIGKNNLRETHCGDSKKHLKP